LRDGADVTERDVSESHLDAIEAQLRLSLLQLEGLRHHLKVLKAQAVTVVRPELPERCTGYDETRCALQSEDGKVKNLAGSFFCRGCRVESVEH
jgi:hypothetical protein